LTSCPGSQVISFGQIRKIYFENPSKFYFANPTNKKNIKKYNIKNMHLTKIVDKKIPPLNRNFRLKVKNFFLFQAHLGQLKRQEQGNSPSQRKFILIFFSGKI